jgi:hypothetical protein
VGRADAGVSAAEVDRRDSAGGRACAGGGIDDDEDRRLVRIVRRDSESVVTWRRAQMVLLSAQGMDVAAIAKVAFTSEDRVRDVIHNFKDSVGKSTFGTGSYCWSC